MGTDVQQMGCGARGTGGTYVDKVCKNWNLYLTKLA